MKRNRNCFFSRACYVLALASLIYTGFLLQSGTPGGTSPAPDPNCQTVVIQPHRYLVTGIHLARQCGDLKRPPVGDRWAEIGTGTRHIVSVPVPMASPTTTAP